MATSLTQASGVRRARTYVPVQRAHQASGDYPTGCTAFLNSIHDARYYRGILVNSANFAKETNCDIYQVFGGRAEWTNAADEAEALEYLRVRTAGSIKEKQALTRPQRSPSKQILMYCVFCEYTLNQHSQPV